MFGAAGAEKFERFPYFSKISFNFVKVEDFFITMHKITKKSKKTTLYRLFFEIFSVPHFERSRLFGDTTLIAPLPQYDP